MIFNITRWLCETKKVIYQYPHAYSNLNKLIKIDQYHKKNVTIPFIEQNFHCSGVWNRALENQTKILNILNFYFKKKIKCKKPQKLISVYIWLLFALNTFFWTMLTCPFRLVREHREHKQINKDRFNKLCFSNKQHQMRMPRPLITYIVYTTQHHDQNLGLFILTFQ